MKYLLPIVAILFGSITSPVFAGTRVGVNTGSQYGLRMGFQDSVSNAVKEEATQSQVGSYATESYTIHDGSKIIDVNIQTESFLEGTSKKVGNDRNSSFVYRTGVSFEQEYDTYGGF